MKVRWWVAKYVPDLNQPEPLPVGVVLLAQDRAYSRFLQEDASSVVSSLSNYEAWVAYWQHHLEAPTPEALSELLTAVPDSNYYLEDTGERAAEHENLEPESLLDELFTLLVAQPLQERAPVESVIAGHIVGLFVNDLDDGQDYILTLRFEEKGQRQQAAIRVSQEQYKMACDAHRDGFFVEVQGRLECHTRPWSIQDPKSFRVLQTQIPSFTASQRSPLLP